MKKGDSVKLIEEYKSGSKIYSVGLTGEIITYYKLPESYKGSEVDDVKVKLDAYDNITEIFPVNILQEIQENEREAVTNHITPDFPLGENDNYDDSGLFQ